MADKIDVMDTIYNKNKMKFEKSTCQLIVGLI